MSKQKEKEVKKQKETKVEETKVKEETKETKVEEKDVKIEKKKLKPIKDETGAFYYPVDETSKHYIFFDHNIFNGNWKRVVLNSEDKSKLGIWYLNLKGNVPNGNVKGYLEYDGKEQIIFEGNFLNGKPLGIHTQYMYNSTEKESIWIVKKHFNEKHKHVKTETNIMGMPDEGTPEEIEEKYNEDEEDNEEETKKPKKVVKKGEKKVDDKPRTKAPLHEKCDELGIKYTKKTTITQLMELIANFKTEDE